jgi:hypothetical protein
VVEALNPLPSNPQESYVYDTVGNRNNCNQKVRRASTKLMSWWRTYQQGKNGR